MSDTETKDPNEPTPSAKKAQKGAPRVYGKCPPIPTLIRHLQAGLNPYEIGRMYSVTEGAVRHKLSRGGVDIKALTDYKKNKADVLSHIQMQIIEALDSGKISKASLRDLAMSWNIFNNAERLERGESTTNVQLSALTSSLKELEELEKKLREEAGV